MLSNYVISIDAVAGDCGLVSSHSECSWHPCRETSTGSEYRVLVFDFPGSVALLLYRLPSWSKLNVHVSHFLLLLNSFLLLGDALWCSVIF